MTRKDNLPCSARGAGEITRRVSRRIDVGGVAVGGGAPITVQSMTNTPTPDIKATLAQIIRIARAGADMVRVSCPDEPSTQALAAIVKGSPVPIIADIHFHYRRAIEAAEAGAACLRINPGNIGSKERVGEVIRAARDHGCAIRIGVNGGSLERHLLEKYGEPCAEAMVESALYHADLLREHDFHEFKISVKASDIFMTVAATRRLAEKIDCPLHLGVTEAGSLWPGTVRSAIGLGALLWEGVGDTLRVSLTEDPVAEVRAGLEILKSLGLRRRGVRVISCPSCARQGFDVITTVRILEERLAHITTPMTLSVIGCVVNGPGEALMSDIGFTGGGHRAGLLYLSGRPHERVPHEAMVERIVEMVEKKAAETAEHDG